MNILPEVSIIVPVYKVENFVSQCIKSILEQSFTDFELLLIDDGSPDNSGKICDEWSRKDNRIRVFHQNNSGVSTARNRGLTEALGRYIVFVDSDDWVFPDYLKGLYESVSLSSGIGLVIQGCCRITPDGEEVSGILLPDRYLTFDDIGKAFTENGISELGYPWAKIYDKQVIVSHSLRFDEKINCCEDLLFMYQYLFYCDYLLLGSQQNYMYVKHPQTLSVRIHSFESEYACFVLYQQLFRKMINVWNMPVDKLGITINSLLIPFQRALKSDYQPKVNVSRIQRVEHLKILFLQNKDTIRKYYRPVFKTDKLGLFLLNSHLFHLYDFYMLLLYRLNIGPVFYGPKHYS